MVALQRLEVSVGALIVRLKMNVEIDEEMCVGAGQCVLTAPLVFDQREEDGIAILVEDPPKSERENVEEAVSRCPSRAIRMTD
ncbi:ferredoxin [Nocardioides sp. LS1]|uniref:ferredoxin n=1 Tax=Nocardioides sp. LS1 TaxID=1027620 RepID=UPI000FF9CC87|nr:ferredoxin [Nocardioides sp. LS1]GCD91163.1 ferredoxin [Nocardioides sp. LS1]